MGDGPVGDGAAGLSVRAVVADRDVDVALDVPAGRVLALLGANGSGKSTTLGVVSGLLTPDAGRVEVAGRVLLDVGGPGRRVDVPAHRRGVALLRQQALLFPHLTVAENVEFAPRAQGRGRREAAQAAARLLAEVDAARFADRRPAALSGGQAQRVAVARALAARPDLLLLDEPFAALDVTTAPELRRLVRRVLLEAGRTAVVVTHDLLDVVALADDVAVLEAGRVVERGTVADVLAAPRSAFAARIVGVNLLAGTGAGASAGGSIVRLAGGPEVVGVADPDVRDGDPVVAVFAPSAVALYAQPPGGSPRNVLPCTVLDATDTGGAVRIRLSLDDPAAASAAGTSFGTDVAPGGAHVVAADVTPAAVADLRPDPGTRLFAVVKATEVAVHPSRRG